MNFFEILDQAELDFFDYLEYLECNNLEFDEYGNVVEKESSLTLKPGNYSDDDE